jgi:murein DD-endopeptidase MepM/ murein hydrolase activator NlpD
LPWLDWPTAEAPTLAPFPLSSDDLAPVPLSLVSDLPASLPLPLALAPQDHFYFSLPVETGDYQPPIASQRYGSVQTNTEADAHLGLDLGLHIGDPILAAAPGSVIWASYGLLYNSPLYLEDPYGIAVVIRHDFGYDGQRLYTVYAHLSEPKVTVGQRVERGDLIGLAGMTGLTTGPHLHFEVRLGGNTIYFTRNPELWIAPPEGWGGLVGRITTDKDALVMNRLVEVTSLDTGRIWTLYTYATNYRLLPDDYYTENFVLGNLPAGRYEVAVPYASVWRRAEVEVTSGQFTYFNFRGLDGYFFALPQEPLPANLPSD